MLERLLTLAIIVGAGYWYWSGPYQERAHPNKDQKLQKITEDMQECMKTKNYAAGRNLKHAGDVETICAQQLNLYFEDGQWYSYDDVRRD